MYNDRKILRDANGDPIPQYFDAGANAYVPFTNEMKVSVVGSPSFQLTGSNAKDNETLSIAQTAVGLTKTSIGATKATITTENNDIRFWLNGGNPTSTSGHLVKAGGYIELDSLEQISKFKAIAISGTAVLQASYF